MPKGDALVETIIKHIFLFPLLRLLGPFLFDCGPIKKLANIAMLFLGSKHLAHASFSNIHSCAINKPYSSNKACASFQPSKWLLQSIIPLLAIIGKHGLLLLRLLDFSNNSIKIDVSLFVETLLNHGPPL